MALVIQPSRLSGVPEGVKVVVSKLQPEEQEAFAKEYESKKKSKALLMILSMTFPIQLFLLGKTGLGIAFWLTGAGMGIWGLIEIFLTPGRVDEYNGDVATKIMVNMKMMETHEPTPAVNVVASTDEKTVTSEPTAEAETVVHIRKRPVAHEPIVGVETVALVKRAFLFLEDGGFDEADRYIEQALNQDPENSKAYIGRLMVNLNVKQEEELQNQSAPLTAQSEYAKALRFADEGYKSVLVGYNQRILDSAGKEAEQKRMEEEKARVNAENLRIKAEKESKGKIYDEAVSSKNESEKSDDFRKSDHFREIAEKFRSLDSFKDAEALALECDELAKKAQAAEEEGRVVEKKRRTKNSKKAILAILAVVAPIIWFGATYMSENVELWKLCQNGTAQQVESAIKAGADVNVKDAYGNTALHIAVQRSNPDLDVITTLMKAGADANIEDKDGMTPLMWAAWKSTDPKIIVSLIQGGADVDVKDKYGKTAYDRAKDNEKLKGTKAYKMLIGNPVRRYMVSTGDNVKVREAPSVKANSNSEIPTINKGNIVLVVEEKQNPGEDYPWRRIVQENYGEEYDWGWVYGQFLRETIEKKNVDMGLDTLNGIAWGTQHSQINGLPALTPAKKEQGADWEFESITKGDYREKGIYLPNSEITYLFDINKCLVGVTIIYWENNNKNIQQIYSFLKEKLGETQDIEWGESATYNYEFSGFKISFSDWGTVGGDGLYYHIQKNK